MNESLALFDLRELNNKLLADIITDINLCLSPNMTNRFELSHSLKQRDTSSEEASDSEKSYNQFWMHRCY